MAEGIRVDSPAQEERSVRTIHMRFELVPPVTEDEVDAELLKVRGWLLSPEGA